MDRGAWWATVHRVAESDTTKQLTLSMSIYNRDHCPHMPSPISESESHSVVFESLWRHRLYSPWNSPGQNTVVGNLSRLQGIFPTQGSNPGLLLCRWILYQLNHQGSPKILEWVASPFSSRSSWPRNRIGVSRIAGGFHTNWAIREAHHQLWVHELPPHWFMALMLPFNSPGGWPGPGLEEARHWHLLALGRHSFIWLNMELKQTWAWRSEGRGGCGLPARRTKPVLVIDRPAGGILLLLSRFSHVWLCATP